MRYRVKIVFLILFTFLGVQVLSAAFFGFFNKAHFRNVAKRIQIGSFDVARAFLRKASQNQSTSDYTELQFLDWWILDKNNSVIAKGQKEDIPKELDLSSIPEGPSPTILSKFNVDRFMVGGGLDPHSNTRLLTRERTSILSFREGRRAFIIQSFVLVGTTILISTGILLGYLRSRSKEADQVMKKLKSGDLLARFQLRPQDEAGQLMVQFNSMADEIQRLVETIRATENNRMELIKELGHDLRTPLMTLQTILETIQMQSEANSPLMPESIELALAELGYLVQLLDDLFLINQMRAPNYVPEKKEIILCDVIGTEIRAIEKMPSVTTKIHQKLEEGAELILAADEKLLRRMIRNIVLNSVRFAKTSVTVSVCLDNSHHRCRIEILDDGPGLSTEALTRFGKRAFARHFNSVSTKRVSTGLGSVIASSIATMHGGGLEIKNEFDNNGAITGALVVIELPALSKEAQNSLPTSSAA